MKLLLLLSMLVTSLGFSAEKVITLTDQNTMTLNGVVNSESMTSLQLQLIKLNKIQTSEPIYLVINSPGGSIYDGFDFIRFAESSVRPINTVTIFAASMAFQIVQALGERNVTSYSTLMSHRARGGFQGEFPGQLDSQYSHVLSHLKEQDTIVVNRTNGKHTLESYAKLIQDEYWANSQRALSDGFADASATVNCSESLQGTHQEIVDLGFFAVDVTYHNCPLITAPLDAQIVRGMRYVRENGIEPLTELKKIFKIKNAKF